MTLDRESAPNASSLLLDVSNIILTVTPKQYYDLNSVNRDLRLELTATGQLCFKPLFVYGIANKYE